MNCETPWISIVNLACALPNTPIHQYANALLRFIKTIRWVITCYVCLALLSCEVDTSYQKRLTEVVQADTIFVTLHSSVGWELVVFPEGSGRLSFSSSRAESIAFSKGTFDYKKLMSQILDHLSLQKPIGKNAVGVTFGLPDPNNHVVEFLTDQVMAKTVFDKAYAAVLSSEVPIYNKRRLKKRYRKRPPVE